MYIFILKMYVGFFVYFIDSLNFIFEIFFLIYFGYKNLERESCCSGINIRMWLRKMKFYFLLIILIFGIR